MNETNEVGFSKFKLFFSIFSRLKSTKKGAWLLTILLIFNVGLTVVQPFFYKIFIEKIQFYTTHKDLLANAGVDLGKTSILLILAIISLIGVKFYYRLYLAKKIYIDWKDFLVETAKNFIDLPINYHINTNIGEKTKIFDRGATGLFWGGFLTLNEILPQAIILILLFCVGMYINVKMALVSFLFLPISLFTVYIVGTKVFGKQKEVDKLWDLAFGRFSDSLLNINIIKIFVKDKKELDILTDKIDNAMIKQFDVEYLWSALMNLLSSFNTVGQVIGMIFGTYMVIKGELTIAELFMFIAISSQVYADITGIFWNMEQMFRHLVHYGRAENIIKMDKEIDTGNNENVIFDKSIEFKNVSFSYPNVDREVLDDLNFTIKKGQKVALVGHTGSGKSTITNILTRFYNFDKGQILLDGVNINEFKLSNYRSKFAQVFQDNTLFNDSILHNLQYVNPEATLDDIKKACKKAQILDFIEGLELKFETVVGERGLKLSGGEKQRIAIARAILTNPEILILDEATSALDTKTENDIQKAFENLMKGRTSIIIAHRLSTIKNADNIYIFDSGKLIGSGTHEVLYNTNPTYKEMVDFQKDGFVE